MPSEPNSPGFTALVSFPKSLNVEREIAVKTCQLPGRHYKSTLPPEPESDDHVCPPTPESEPWTGWGTATKPAYEPIVVARRPLSEKNVASQVLKTGTGAINIDATRVGNTRAVPASLSKNKTPNGIFNEYGGGAEKELDPNKGRWSPNLLLSHSPGCRPTGEIRRVKVNDREHDRNNNANNGTAAKGKQYPHKTTGYADPDGYEGVEEYLCVDSCPVRLMDEQSGQSKSTIDRNPVQSSPSPFTGAQSVRVSRGDSGGASRFFPRFPLEPGEAPFLYSAKASRRERNAGLEGMPEHSASVGNKEAAGRDGAKPGNALPGGARDRVERGLPPTMPRANNHPTVKPLALMRWLVRLVCPPNGTVLDPFMGSGSTGCAATLEGFNFIGIEQDLEYAEIARRRIAHWSNIPDTRSAESKNGKAPVAEVQTPKPLETLF